LAGKCLFGPILAVFGDFDPLKLWYRSTNRLV